MQKETQEEKNVNRLISEGKEWIYKLSLMWVNTEDKETKAELVVMIEQSKAATEALESRLKEIRAELN
jgi:hypothetical protein